MSNPLVKLFLNFFLCLPLGLFAQLVIQVNSIPANTPTDDDIFVAGSFNSWQEGNTAYILQETNPGSYEISLDISPGTYEFKFTRGSWATVEGTAEGNFRPNREVVYSGGTQTETLAIAGWEDISGSGSSNTADNVEILAEDFYMPQLDRNRRIWVYLPPDYYTSTRSYPVMYMHDGQNLFDANAPFGEWGVDESLNTLFEQGDYGIIIIGIDHGNAERISELTPYPNQQYGGGDGDAYVNFIVETLKPHVDANYRTLSDQPHTGIMGSSLGGLISLYAIIEHQDVFGRAGVFSPSLWFSPTEMQALVSSTGRQQSLKIDLVAGEMESSTMVPNMEAMYNTLLEAGFSTDEIRITSHPDGEHSEWYWRREFPGTYQWLFQNISTLDTDLELEGIQYWPNPARDWVQVDGLDTSADNWQATIYNINGQVVSSNAVLQDRIDLVQLISGPYFILLRNTEGQWALLHLNKL